MKIKPIIYRQRVKLQYESRSK